MVFNYKNAIKKINRNDVKKVIKSESDVETKQLESHRGKHWTTYSVDDCPLTKLLESFGHFLEANTPKL